MEAGHIPIIPDAAYWDIVDRERYDWARDKLKSLAQGIGIVVIDSTPLLREMRPYRDPEDPRRTTWARYVDYGPSGHWRYVVHVVLSVGMCVCPMTYTMALGQSRCAHKWRSLLDHAL